MGRCPIVSYGGDCSLFCGLQGSLVSALPEETVEWRRSFGRASKFVNIEVDFVPFSDECLVKDPSRSVLQQPVFHTYWTDCTDVETYKSSVKEDVQSWVTQLRGVGVTDWMVVVVGAPENKKTNKLLSRSSVLDRMKADFGGKQAERCVSLYEPVKTDSRSMESWQSLLAKMRSLTMVAYNRALNRFEEQMRGERERRTEKSWSFCRYFSVQEELAAVMTSLGAHEDALVQYDELDALLTQFVLNSAAGDTPLWLANFRQTCERWEGLYLGGTAPNRAVQSAIQSKSVSLLDLRNYLFQQQAALLIKLNKPWDVAVRAVAFLHNTVQELTILTISIAPSGIACWGFLSCLEVIHTLSRHNTPTTTQLHARHTAPLWAYARDKLLQLGTKCGLFPGGSEEGSSEQLHTVITLVCGMGNDPHDDVDNASPDDNITDAVMTKNTTNEGSNQQKSSAADRVDAMTPMTRLKEALSSKDSYKKHYLELCEVAISTHKHIGHVRSARLIGRDLAAFYLALGEPQQAANFLSDLINSFSGDGCWPLLAAETRLQLQTCYRDMQDYQRLVRVSAELATCCSLDLTKRVAAFNVMSDAAKDLTPDEVVTMSADDVIHVTQLTVTSPGPVTVGSMLRVTATLYSTLPCDALLHNVEVLLKLQQTEDSPSGQGSSSSSSTGGRKKSSADSTRVERKASAASKHLHSSSAAGVGVNRSNSGGSDSSGRRNAGGAIAEETQEDLGDSGKFGRLHMSLSLDYQQDSRLATAAVVCRNTHAALSRRDSHSSCCRLQPCSPADSDCRLSIAGGKPLPLPPGSSEVQLEARVGHKGALVWRGATVKTDCLELLQHSAPANCRGGAILTEALQQAPRLTLSRKGRDLIAGLTQHMILTVHAGTAQLEQGTRVEVRTSRGLLLSPTVQQLVNSSETDCDSSQTTVNSSVTSESGSSQPALVAIETIVPSTNSTSDSTNGKNTFSAATAAEDSSLVREVTLLLPYIGPLSTASLQLSVLAILGPQRDTNAVDHIVSLTSPGLLASRQDVDVHFTPPFCSLSKLHTANTQKFFQVKINGLEREPVTLASPQLCIQQSTPPADVATQLTPVHAADQPMVVSSDQSCSYMWQLDVSGIGSGTAVPLKLELSLQYWSTGDYHSSEGITGKNPSEGITGDNSSDGITQEESPIKRTYRCTFDLSDYLTVFTIKSRVEPGKGTEFCRAGSMCHLNITLESPRAKDKENIAIKDKENTESTPAQDALGGYDSIMYEVLADQTMWAVCGRTSGVLSVECARRRQVVTLDVMPLTGGFLPLPSVRLSKYIPADMRRSDVQSASSIPRLEPFAPGQVYNCSKGAQVHVLTAAGSDTAAH